jgi:hypothetical protein
MARISWQAASELVAGKVVFEGLDHNQVTLDMLSPPYDDVLHAYKRGVTDPTELAEVVGLEIITACHEATKRTSGLPLDWIELLSSASARADAGKVMLQIGKTLERGEVTDVSPVYAAIKRMERGHTRLIRADQIEPDEQLYRTTGFLPLDHHLGGLPIIYPSVFGAPPGTGKTTLLADIAIAEADLSRKVVIFTLEMTARHLLARMFDLRRMTKKIRKHIYFCPEIIPITEIVAVASRAAADGVDFIGIDFADLVVRGEETEQKMAAVYKGCQELTKNIDGLQLLLLSQLNRRYAGGIPKLHHLRYSGMAEALCGLVGFIHNPKNIITEAINERESMLLPSIKGRGYLLISKSKGGFGIHDAPGAIACKWNGKSGWGKKDPGKWIGLEGL